MEGQIPEETKTKRSDMLLALSKKNQQAYERRLLGSRVEVLMEESRVFQGEVYQIGHTREYVQVAVPVKKDLSNQLVRVFVDDLADFGILCGHLADADRK